MGTAVLCVFFVGRGLRCCRPAAVLVIFELCSFPAWISTSPFYPFLLWPTRSFCLDPLIPSIFIVSDHIEYKSLDFSHIPGIILFDLPFSSVPVYWKNYSWYILQLHQPLCGWIMLMTHGHAVNDYFQSGLSPLLALSQFSPQLTANLCSSLCVPDLALQAVKFNLNFIASLLKIIRFLLYNILPFLSVNIVSLFCVINYFY